MNGAFVGVFDVWLVGLVFAVFLLIISLVYYGAGWRTKTNKHAPGKRKPYLCGEDSREGANMPHMGFYKTVVSGMKFKKLKRIQSGDLSEYILALLIGIITFLAVFVFLW